MDKKDVSVGMRVRVSDDPGSQIYTVEAFLTPFTVNLVYKTETGKLVSGGRMDVSILKSVKRKR
jgi:hypothetical protein